VRHPARYADERGRRMWETVCGLLAEAEREDDPCTGAGGGSRAGAAPVQG
jgi:hypothetical protein